MGNEYKPGIRYFVDFGECSQDAMGLCILGYSSNPAAGYAAMAANSAEPRDCACQTVSYWFRFADIRPYGKVTELAEKIAGILKEKGWTIKKTFIENLADTDAPSYWGKPESKFPREPQAHGYNAAGGFNLIAEKPGTKPVLTQEEAIEVQRLAIIFSDIVFGRQLNRNAVR
jgi:hypothetical protein